MTTIQNVKKMFSPDFAAARDLVIEKFGADWLKVVKAYRAERSYPLDEAIFDLADGAELKGNL